MKISYQEELLNKGILAFVPRGNSMWPFLKNHKQSVVVVPKKEKLNKFDVGLYQSNDGKYILHRVLESTETGYIMCGDSRFVLESVEEDKVFGVMQGFYKGKTYIDCTDEKYCKKVRKWYKSHTLRKIRIKFYYFRQRIKSCLIKIFKKKDK